LIRVVLGFALIGACAHAEVKRLVMVKVDGLPAYLVERYVLETDPRTGRSLLPWIKYIFGEQGAWVHNFYVRGISLSAPSWCELDTGQHTVIHGNAEYDRYGPHVYDYLNFFPFYVGYARSQHVDMPGVEVLDQNGISLLIDSFRPDQRFVSMQLFQRGVKWKTLQHSLENRVFRSPRELLNEWQTGFEMSRGIAVEVEREMIGSLADSKILYLDYFTGEYDHVGHLTGDEPSQYEILRALDNLLGRIWNAIQASPLADETVLVLVSDHGMNTDPKVYSQGFNLVRYFTSAEGGGHHVLTNRHPLQIYKLRGLDPFVERVITPAQHSFYLSGKQDQYPTAQLDLDGNERAGVQLRNSDLNELQIAFQTGNLNGAEAVINRNRTSWSATIADIREELAALHRAIQRQTGSIEAEPKKTLDSRRLRSVLERWQQDERRYADYVRAMTRLLDWKTAMPPPPIPERVMGDPNSAAQLRSYVAGPGRRINYFQALTSIRTRNNVQPVLSQRPIDFVAVRAGDSVLVYGDEDHQLRVESRTNQDGALLLRVIPVEGWGPGYPLALFEDPDLAVEGDRAEWLSSWHTDSEWLEATHRTRYSNGVVDLNEQFRRWRPAELPPVFRAAADGKDWPVLLRFIERSRALAENDLLVLASDHWNFNVRSFNPGGNHGSFFRSSTRSVLMLAGAEVPKGLSIEQPYDSLSLVPTLLTLTGRLNQNNPVSYPGPIIEPLLWKK
jgi:hypothetical protein